MNDTALLVKAQQISQIHGIHEFQSVVRESGIGTTEVRQDTELRLEQLEHYLKKSAFFMLKCFAALNDIASDYAGTDKTKATVYSLNDTECMHITFYAETCLHAIRRTQNSLWPYVSFIVGKHVKHSMRELISDIEKDKIEMDVMMKKPLLDYWNCFGSELKKLRDTEEHSFSIFSDLRIRKNEYGVVTVQFTVPLNPTEGKQNLSRVNYGEHTMSSGVIFYERIGV